MTKNHSALCAALALLVAGTATYTLQACLHTPQKAINKVETYPDHSQAYKINLNLLRLEEEVREGLSLEGAAIQHGIATTDDGIMLDIATRDLDPGIEEKFLLPGVTVRHFSTQYNRVSAIINDLSLLYDLAEIPEVRMISPEYGAKTRDGLDGLQR